jgi:micrococcal nuclease
MRSRTIWPPEDRRSRSPRFPYRGARTLLVLAVAGTLFTTWSVLAPRERQASPPEKPVQQPAPPPQPQPAPENAPEKPAPPEADTCPEGCTSPKPGCDIKGNISLKKGERIYHLPGQKWYGRTVISPEKGERWFCTEEEAEANGWRQAKV